MGEKRGEMGKWFCIAKPLHLYHFYLEISPFCVLHN